MSSELLELEKILDSLTVTYGAWKVNHWGIKYQAIDDKDRYEVLGYLVNTLKDAGKGEEYFRTSVVREFIAKYFFSEARTRNKNSRETEGCYRIVYGELRRILATVWPIEGISSETVKVGEVIVPPKPVIPLEPVFVGEDVTKTPYKDGQCGIQIDEDFVKTLGEIK